MKYLIPFVMLFCLVSCKPSKPDYVLSEETMEDILFDYQLAIGMAENEDGDIEENRYVRVHRVFDKYGITEEEFDSSMVYWCRHAEDFKQVTQKVCIRLEQKALALGISETGSVSNSYTQLSANGDTANIWNGNKSVLLTSVKGYNLYRYTITADTTTHSGDTYMLAFVSNLLSPSSKRDVYAQLIVEYSNDSVVSSMRTIYNDGLTELRNTLKDEYRHWKPKTLNIVVYIPSTEENRYSLLSLNQIALIRYHNKAVELKSLATDTIGDVTNEELLDSLPSVRLAPHDVRGDDAKEHTINVVKESNVKWVKRKKRK